MKKLFILFMLFIPFILTGCLSSGEDIMVNKDGSGQIIQTFMVKKDYVGFLNLSDQPSDPNLINMDELTAAAEFMGDGVTFDKVEPMPEDSLYAGYKAYYTFEDISKVKANATPVTSPEAAKDNEADSIRFEFTSGKTSALTILMPKNNPAGTEDSVVTEKNIETDKAGKADDASMTEQLKQIYKDMHYWIRISVAGDITDTDARHVDNSTIIILDMTFDKIVDNDELFAKITADNSNKEMEQFADELSDVGVLVEDKDIVSVKFK